MFTESFLGLITLTIVGGAFVYLLIQADGVRGLIKQIKTRLSIMIGKPVQLDLPLSKQKRNAMIKEGIEKKVAKARKKSPAYLSGKNKKGRKKG
tara:strand:+ start:348 stop:629 length:282 start_codon:yes stop_codon:yes gene_type:complete